jgi:hypothetical protein
MLNFLKALVYSLEKQEYQMFPLEVMLAVKIVRELILLSLPLDDHFIRYC